VQATVADVRSFFDTWYVPKNASLVIAGDFDKAEAKKLVDKYFGWIPSAAPPPSPTAAPVVLAAPKSKTLTDRVKLPRTYLTYHAPAEFAEGSAECDVVASILGGAKSSRLSRALKIERQLAQDTAVFCDSRKLGSVFMVLATARPGKTLAEIEKVIDAEIGRLRSEPPSTAELERSIAAIEMGTAQSLEQVSQRADLLNSYEAAFHDPGRLGWDLARYRAVTAAGVQAWAQKFLDPNTRLVLHVVPAPDDKADKKGAE